MRLLFRDGRLVIRDGKAVTDDCPEPCCGDTGCYTRFVTCQYTPGNLTVPCATVPIDQEIYVSRPVLLALRDSSSCNFIDTNTGVLYYGGRCYTADTCQYYYPPETPDPPFGLIPIPPGNVPITGPGDVDCLTDCTDLRCYEAAWVPLVACPDQPNQLQRPNYVCARAVSACGIVRVTNDFGKLVCTIANPTNPLSNTQVDPAGVFYETVGILYGGTCCYCLESVPESDCFRNSTDTNNPCFPWSGEPPDDEGRAWCCCRSDDVICVDEYIWNYEPVAADIALTGFKVFKVGNQPVCGAPGANSVDVPVYVQYSDPSNYGSNHAETRQIGGYTPCSPSGNATDLIPFDGWANTYCTDPVVGDNRTVEFVYERNCYGASLRVKMNQYEPGTQTLRAVWTFRFRVRRVSTGGCAGGCGGAASGGGNALFVKAGGCAGCKGERRTEIKA